MYLFFHTKPPLALLWQILRLIGETGFPNQIFGDSWVVGFWRADHGGHDVEVGKWEDELGRLLKPFLDRLSHRPGGGCVRCMFRD